jgi:hypothetical protein
VGFKHAWKGTTGKNALSGRKSVLFSLEGLLRSIQRKGRSYGALGVGLIVLVVAAIAGGIGVSPLLWLLLLVALVVFFTGGGFGYRRGGRI